MNKENKFIPWGFYYFSKTHIKFAAIFAKQAKEIEQQTEKKDYILVGDLDTNSHSSYVVSSLIMSAAYLEAFINETFTTIEYEADDRKAESIFKAINFEKHEKLNKLWKMRIPRTAKYKTLEKYEFLLIELKNEKYDKGVSLYQNVDTLIKLRNYFIHYEPERIEHPTRDNENVEIANLGKKLKGKFALNPNSYDYAPLFPDKCLSFGCALWAIKSVLEFTEDFAKKIEWEAYSDYTWKMIAEIVPEIEN